MVEWNGNGNISTDVWTMELDWNGVAQRRVTGPLPGIRLSLSLADHDRQLLVRRNPPALIDRARDQGALFKPIRQLQAIGWSPGVADAAGSRPCTATGAAESHPCQGLRPSAI